ncbi:MAG: sulfotransferase [Candidatus Promineifilaceae bacterium]
MGQKALIIAGMHRSGTSLLARFAHLAGVDLGDQLLSARQYNPFGYFEDVEILAFHSQILRRESGHSMWARRPPLLIADDRAQARQLAAARTQKALWGWKEPRTCLFLDLWNEILPESHFLFVVRHPSQVVDSLARRSHRTRLYWPWRLNLYLSQWLLYNRACLALCASQPARTLVSALETTLDHPAAFAARLSAWFGHEFSAERLRQAYETPALKQDARWPGWISGRLKAESLALYEELKRLAAA